MSPLEQRLSCRQYAAHHPMGGERCSKLAANAPDAMEKIRYELKAGLYMVFGFLIGNVWLMHWYGSGEVLFQKGKGALAALFVLIAMLGHVRASYAEFGELRWK